MDEQAPNPFAGYLGALPEGSIPSAAVAVISYLDPTGKMGYAVCHSGDVPLSTFLGLLELGKVRVMEHFEENR